MNTKKKSDFKEILGSIIPPFLAVLVLTGLVILFPDSGFTGVFVPIGLAIFFYTLFMYPLSHLLEKLKIGPMSTPALINLFIILIPAVAAVLLIGACLKYLHLYLVYALASIGMFIPTALIWMLIAPTGKKRASEEELPASQSGVGDTPPGVPGEVFEEFKKEVECHTRANGYYIIGLIPIVFLRENGKSQAEILDYVIDYFDDDPNEYDASNVPAGASREDCEVSFDEAREECINALRGGNDIGHLTDTIPLNHANIYFDKFNSFFRREKHYYKGMGIGNPEYVFLHGVLIVDDTNAGVLWVVEND
ncbi:MAG: hypothetical protein GY757_49240 [bacterium]|nr:hypothetical protein [bacterium]